MATTIYTQQCLLMWNHMNSVFINFPLQLRALDCSEKVLKTPLLNVIFLLQRQTLTLSGKHYKVYKHSPELSITHVLQPCNILCCTQTDNHFTTTIYRCQGKDKPDRQGAVCKIKCCDCQATCIGETGRNLSSRLTEQNGEVNNHIAEYYIFTNETSNRLGIFDMYYIHIL